MATNSFQLELPSSKAVLTFRTPIVEDRCKVLKDYDGKESGFTVEDTLAIRCLERINGEKVDPDIDPRALLGQMELQDYNYYFDIYSAMFFSDMKKRESAQDVAKKLLSGESLIGIQKPVVPSVKSGRDVG